MKYEEIFTKFERGNITEDEFNEQFKQDMPDLTKEIKSYLLPASAKEVGFRFSNNPYLKLMKKDRYSDKANLRAFSVKAVYLNNELKVVEKASYTGSKNKQEQQNKWIRWDYASENMNNEKNYEEVIKINRGFENGYVFVYLLADNFEPFLTTRESCRAAEYQLFDPKTDVAFLEGEVGKNHDGMFLVNVDDLRSKQTDPADAGDADVQPEAHLECVIGCFLLYHGKQGLIVDHLTSFAYDRVGEETFLHRISASLKSTAGPGDIKGMQTFWNSKLDAKRAQDSASYQKQRKTIMAVGWFDSRTMMTMITRHLLP